MSLSPEQLGPGGGTRMLCPKAAARLRRTLKREATRKERRAARRLLDDAPERRRWRGYGS